MCRGRRSCLAERRAVGWSHCADFYIPVGGLADQFGSVEQSADMFVDIIQTLLTRCKDLEPVRASASWALANCCDILTPTFVPSHLLTFSSYRP